MKEVFVSFLISTETKKQTKEETQSVTLHSFTIPKIERSKEEKFIYRKLDIINTSI